MSKGSVFLAYTYSPLHAGIGQTMGMVDLPIEREKHTGYPCVYATGLKGSLRAYWKQQKYSGLVEVFGAEDASAGAGGAVFSDLKILLFPVRASEGTFKWVTCNKVLNRFKRDYEIAMGFELKNELELKYLKQTTDIPNHLNAQDYLLLEDFIFNKSTIDKNNKIFQIPGDSGILQENIYLVDDDYFDYFVRHATQVIARNKLKGNKTSENLWYEEALPADTVLYSFVKPSITGAEEQLKSFSTNFDNKIVQIGGGETVGYGIVKLSFLQETKEQTDGNN